MITISRPINEVTLNGDEYVLNENGEVRKFGTEMDARTFMVAEGIPVEDLECFNYNEEYE